MEAFQKTGSVVFLGAVAVYLIFHGLGFVQATSLFGVGIIAVVAIGVAFFADGEAEALNARRGSAIMSFGAVICAVLLASGEIFAILGAVAVLAMMCVATPALASELKTRYFKLISSTVAIIVILWVVFENVPRLLT